MPGVAIDPQLQTVIDAMGGMPYIDLDTLPPGEAMRIARPEFPYPPAPANSEDHTLTGCDGHHLRLRLYYPATRGEQLSIVLYLHGGGFVAGSIEMDDRRCSRLAETAQCVVASLDYRLAPEHPFPAAIHDAGSAWSWLVDNAPQLGAATHRGAIYGSSAGGHIAVGALLQARDCGAPMPDFLLLANPALDPAMASHSYREFRDGPFMTAQRMSWYWRQYAGGRTPQDDPLWSPLTAEFGGLPPAHVMTAEYDVLRDEGEAFAARLRAAGIESTVERFPGMIHGFINVVPDHVQSVRAMDSSGEILRRAMGN